MDIKVGIRSYTAQGTLTGQGAWFMDAAGVAAASRLGVKADAPPAGTIGLYVPAANGARRAITNADLLAMHDETDILIGSHVSADDVAAIRAAGWVVHHTTTSEDQARGSAWANIGLDYFRRKLDQEA